MALARSQAREGHNARGVPSPLRSLHPGPPIIANAQAQLLRAIEDADTRLKFEERTSQRGIAS